MMVLSENKRSSGINLGDKRKRVGQENGKAIHVESAMGAKSKEATLLPKGVKREKVLKGRWDRNLSSSEVTPKRQTRQKNNYTFPFTVDKPNTKKERKRKRDSVEGKGAQGSRWF